MGSSNSTNEKPVGMWFTGVPMSQSDYNDILRYAQEGRVREVPTGVSVPDGCALLASAGSRRFCLQNNPSINYWNSKKTEIINGLSKSNKYIAKNTRIAEAAIPYVLFGDKQTAMERATEAADGDTAVADVVVGKLYSAIGQSGVKTGMGQRTKLSAYHKMLHGSCDGRRGAGSGSVKRPIVPRLGGIDEYVNSANSEVTKKLIKSLMGVATRLLGGSVKVTGDDAKDIKALINAMPGGNNLTKDDKMLSELCNEIAKEINAGYGQTIISLDLPREQKCKAIAELLTSLTSGVHSEFLMIQNDIKRIMGNLYTIKDLIKTERKTLQDDIANAKNIADMRNLATMRNNIFDMMDSELSRQMKMLENITKVNITPSESQLATLLKNYNNLDSFVRDMDTRNKTDIGVRQVVANLLSGIGVTAAVANVVNKALADIGITLEQYKKMNRTDLLHAVNEKILSSGINADMSKILGAAKTLSDNMKNIDQLTPEKSGRGEDDGDNVYDGGSIDYPTVTDTETTSRPVKLMREIENKEKVRALIFEGLARELDSIFSNIIKSIDAFADTIGKTSPITNELGILRRALAGLQDDYFEKNKFRSVIGYYNDAKSRAVRDSLMASLSQAASALEVLENMNAYEKSKPQLRDCRENILKIVETLNKYADEFGRRFGVTYGGSGESDLLASPAPIFKSVIKMSEIFSRFDHKYRVAQITENMKINKGQFDEFSKGYPELLATNIAEKIKHVRQLTLNVIGFLGEIKGVRGNATYSPDNVDASMDAIEKRAKAIENSLIAYNEVRINFWQTLEALDTYLMNYTGSLRSLPDMNIDLKSMIDSIEIISQWYDDKTIMSFNEVIDNAIIFNISGDDVSYANPAISGKDGAGNNIAAIPPLNNDIAAYINNINGKQKLPKGNDLINNVNMDIGRSIQNIKSAYAKFYALKNILSIFNTISIKSAESKSSFMSVGKMYANFIDYLAYAGINYGVNNLHPYLLNSKVYLHNTKRRTLGTLAQTLSISPRIISDDNAFDYIERGVDDQYFTHAMKAIVSKILVTSGLYGLHNNPDYINHNFGTRLILGAAESDAPIIKEAIPLYLRLPLLCIFYQKFMGTNKIADGTNNIELIPEINGMFSGLIKFVFRDKKIHIEKYTESEVAYIIREVNNIYNDLKNVSGDVVNIAVSKLVSEINKRIGIVTNDELKKYSKFVDDRYKYNDDKSIGDKLARDYPLLEGEQQNFIDRVPPSQKYLMPIETVADQISAADVKHWTYINLLSKFHEKVENEFNAKTLSTADKYTLVNSINRTITEVNNENDPKKQFKLVCKMITANSNANTDDNVVTLYHETVISGLNTLSAIHTTLENIRALVYILNYNHADEIAEYILTSASRTLSAGISACANVLHKITGLSASIIQVILGNIYNPAYVYNTAGKINTHVDKALVVNGDLTFANNAGNLSVTLEAGCYRSVEMFAPIIDGTLPVPVAVLNYSQEGVTDYLIKIQNKQYMLKTFIEMLYTFSGDYGNLVSVSINKKGVNINASDLINAVNELFDNIKYFMDKLNPHIDTRIRDFVMDKETIGSYYWLQERLVERIFIGRGHNPSDEFKYMTFNEMNIKINKVYKKLVLDDKNYNYLTAINQLTSYDTENPLGYTTARYNASGNASAGYYLGQLKLPDIINDAFDKLLISADGTHEMVDTRFMLQYRELSQDFDSYGSCFSSFNNLFKRYLKSFYDPFGKKIYGGLVNKTAQIFSKEITDIETCWNDTYPCVVYTEGDKKEVEIKNFDRLVTAVEGVKTVISALPTVMSAATISAERLGEETQDELTDTFVATLINQNMVGKARGSWGGKRAAFTHFYKIYRYLKHRYMGDTPRDACTAVGIRYTASLYDKPFTTGSHESNDWVFTSTGYVKYSPLHVKHENHYTSQVILNCVDLLRVGHKNRRINTIARDYMYDTITTVNRKRDVALATHAAREASSIYTSMIRRVGQTQYFTYDLTTLCERVAIFGYSGIVTEGNADVLARVAGGPISTGLGANFTRKLLPMGTQINTLMEIMAFCNDMLRAGTVLHTLNEAYNGAVNDNLTRAFDTATNYAAAKPGGRVGIITNACATDVDVAAARDVLDVEFKMHILRHYLTNSDASAINVKNRDLAYILLVLKTIYDRICTTTTAERDDPAKSNTYKKGALIRTVAPVSRFDDATLARVKNNSDTGVALSVGTLGVGASDYAPVFSNLIAAADGAGGGTLGGGVDVAVGANKTTITGIITGGDAILFRIGTAVGATTISRSMLLSGVDGGTAGVGAGTFAAAGATDLQTIFTGLARGGIYHTDTMQFMLQWLQAHRPREYTIAVFILLALEMPEADIPIGYLQYKISQPALYTYYSILDCDEQGRAPEGGPADARNGRVMGFQRGDVTSSVGIVGSFAMPAELTVPFTTLNERERVRMMLRHRINNNKNFTKFYVENLISQHNIDAQNARIINAYMRNALKYRQKISPPDLSLVPGGPECIAEINRYVDDAHNVTVTYLFCQFNDINRGEGLLTYTSPNVPLAHTKYLGYVIRSNECKKYFIGTIPTETYDYCKIKVKYLPIPGMMGDAIDLRYIVELYHCVRSHTCSYSMTDYLLSMLRRKFGRSNIYTELVDADHDGEFPHFDVPAIGGGGPTRIAVAADVEANHDDTSMKYVLFDKSNNIIGTNIIASPTVYRLAARQPRSTIFEFLNGVLPAGRVPKISSLIALGTTVQPENIYIKQDLDAAHSFYGAWPMAVKGFEDKVSDIVLPIGISLKQYLGNIGKTVGSTNTVDIYRTSIKDVRKNCCKTTITMDHIDEPVHIKYCEKIFGSQPDFLAGLIELLKEYARIDGNKLDLNTMLAELQIFNEYTKLCHKGYFTDYLYYKTLQSAKDKHNADYQYLQYKDIAESRHYIDNSSGDYTSAAKYSETRDTRPETAELLKAIFSHIGTKGAKIGQYLKPRDADILLVTAELGAATVPTGTNPIDNHDYGTAAIIALLDGNLNATGGIPAKIICIGIVRCILSAISELSIESGVNIPTILKCLHFYCTYKVFSKRTTPSQKYSYKRYNNAILTIIDILNLMPKDHPPTLDNIAELRKQLSANDKYNKYTDHIECTTEEFVARMLMQFSSDNRGIVLGYNAAAGGGGNMDVKATYRNPLPPIIPANAVRFVPYDDVSVDYMTGLIINMLRESVGLHTILTAEAPICMRHSNEQRIKLYNFKHISCKKAAAAISDTYWIPFKMDLVGHYVDQHKDFAKFKDVHVIDESKGMPITKSLYEIFVTSNIPSFKNKFIAYTKPQLFSDVRALNNLPNLSANIPKILDDIKIIFNGAAAKTHKALIYNKLNRYVQLTKAGSPFKYILYAGDGMYGITDVKRQLIIDHIYGHIYNNQIKLLPECYVTNNDRIARDISSLGYNVNKRTVNTNPAFLQQILTYFVYWRAELTGAGGAAAYPAEHDKVPHTTDFDNDINYYRFDQPVAVALIPPNKRYQYAVIGGNYYRSIDVITKTLKDDVRAFQSLAHDHGVRTAGTVAAVIAAANVILTVSQQAIPSYVLAIAGAGPIGSAGTAAAARAALVTYISEFTTKVDKFITNLLNRAIDYTIPLIYNHKLETDILLFKAGDHTIINKNSVKALLEPVISPFASSAINHTNAFKNSIIKPRSMADREWLGSKWMITPIHAYSTITLYKPNAAKGMSVPDLNKWILSQNIKDMNIVLCDTAQSVMTANYDGSYQPKTRAGGRDEVNYMIPYADYIKLYTGTATGKVHSESSHSKCLMRFDSPFLLTSSIADTIADIFKPTKHSTDIKEINGGVTDVELGPRIMCPIAESTILYATNAIALRNLISNKKKGSLEHIYENVTDIPAYMKDRMKTIGPYYLRAFNELATRCRFIQEVIDQADLAIKESPVDVKVGGVYTYAHINQYPYKMYENKNNKREIVGVLNKIKTCSSAISEFIKQTLRDIGDDPVFGEIYPGFAKDYKASNSSNPPAPLSMLTIFCGNVPYMEYNFKKDAAADEIKVLNSVRKLLINSNNLTPNDLEYFTSLSSNVAHIVPIDKARPLAFANTLTTLSRFLIKNRYIKPMTQQISSYLPVTYKRQEGDINNLLLHTETNYLPQGVPVTLYTDEFYNVQTRAKTTRTGHANNTTMDYYVSNKKLVNTGLGTFSLIAQKLGPNITDSAKVKSLLTYQLSRKINDIVLSIESENKKYAKQFSASFIEAANTKYDNIEIDILNVLDLNIVPFDMSMFMRDIPLTHIINYSYTFDRMLAEFISQDKENSAEILKKLYEGTHGNTVHETFVESMVIPYKRRINTVLAEYLDHMIKPPNIPDLGRPRFLSEELAQKLLLVSGHDMIKSLTPYGPISNTTTNNTIKHHLKAHMVAYTNGLSIADPDTEITRDLTAAGRTLDFNNNDVFDPVYKLYKNFETGKQVFLTELYELTKHGGTLNLSYNNGGGGDAGRDLTAQRFTVYNYGVIVKAVEVFKTIINDILSGRGFQDGVDYYNNRNDGSVPNYTTTHNVRAFGHVNFGEPVWANRCLIGIDTMYLDNAIQVPYATIIGYALDATMGAINTLITPLADPTARINANKNMYILLNNSLSSQTDHNNSVNYDDVYRHDDSGNIIMQQAQIHPEALTYRANLHITQSLVFITNLYRVLRAKITRDTMPAATFIAHNNRALTDSVSEFRSANSYPPNHQFNASNFGTRFNLV